MNTVPFTWDPNSNQTYTGDSLTVRGTVGSFDKNRGKSFTMDAPGRTLQLVVVGGGGMTKWAELTVIDAANGTLLFDGRQSDMLWAEAGDKITLKAKNDGKLNLQGIGDIQVNGPVVFEAYGTGLISIDCQQFMTTQNMNVNLFDKSQMTINCPEFDILQKCTLKISSSPDSGHSLEWVGNGSEGEIVLTETDMTFSNKASGLLKTASLSSGELGGRESNIEARDEAKIQLYFDTIKIKDSSRFTLGLGSPEIRFDAFTAGKQPFDFANGFYPEGLFNFVSDGGANADDRQYLIRGSTADAASILNKGLVAIDGEPQFNGKRIEIRSKQDGYIHIVEYK